MANRPNGQSGAGSGEGFFVNLLSIEFVRSFKESYLSRVLSSSIVWFWKRLARVSRHERLMIRSARMNSIGESGSSSARSWRR